MWAMLGYGGGKLALALEFVIKLNETPSDGKYNYFHAIYNFSKNRFSSEVR